MIRLTRIDYDGNKKPIIIDAESIESIEDGDKRTELTTKRGWTFYVVESRDEVARKVLEYKLLTQRYESAFYHRIKYDSVVGYEEASHSIEQSIFKLSGLEEPNHD